MSRTMFAPSLVHQGSSLALPSLLLGANTFGGPDSIMSYPTGLLSRTQPDLTSRFMADRLSVPHGLSPFGMRPELHHHQHLHQHMHQHLMPPPHPSGPSSSSSIESAVAAAAAANPGTAFGSAAASSLLLGMAGYSTLGAGSSLLPGLPGPRHGPSLALPSSMALPLVGGPLGLPLTNGLSGAFQPKNDVNPLLMSGVQDRLSAAGQPRVKKSGQWCTAHVRVAWEIHLHQQKEKQFQSDVQRIGANAKGAAESTRLNEHPLNLPAGDGVLPGHLESLYRLGVPLFGRSPFSACSSSARNPLSHLPFGGLGGTVHRMTGQPDAAAGGFVGAASDWLRLSKSSPFPCPPPPTSLWVRAPEGTNRERDKAEDRDDEGQSKLSSAQEMIENNRERESLSRRSSGSARNERTRSRSPRRHGRKVSSSRESASSPGGNSSTAQRPTSDRSESRDSDSRRQAHRARHTASTSPATTNDPTAPTPPFLTGQIYPARSEPGVFMPYLWTNPLDGDQLMRRLLGSADDSMLKADRLAHLDLMFGKIPPPLPPGGLGLPFRHLPSPGRLGKTGLSTFIPPRFPITDSNASSLYKVFGDSHHSEFR